MKKIRTIDTRQTNRKRTWQRSQQHDIKIFLDIETRCSKGSGASHAPLDVVHSCQSFFYLVKYKIFPKLT